MRILFERHKHLCIAALRSSRRSPFRAIISPSDVTIAHRTIARGEAVDTDLLPPE